MTEASPGRFVEFQRWLKFNYPQVLTLIGTAAVSFGSIGGLVDKEAWSWFVWVITAGVVLTAAGGVAGLYVGPSVVRLIAAEAQSRARVTTLISGIRSAFSGELAQVLRFLGRYGPGARASLYLHVEGAFQIVSRSSSDPTLRHFGRSSYPLSQGVIGRAWSDGEAVAVDLPKRRDLWNAHMARNYAIPADEAAKLRMQSRSLVALRIDHDGPAGARPLGVVVMESVKPNAMGSDQRDSIMGSAEWRMFSAAVIGGLDALRSASFSEDSVETRAAITASLAGVGEQLGGTRPNEREGALTTGETARTQPLRRRSVPVLVTNWSAILGVIVLAVGIGLFAADPARDPRGVGIVMAALAILFLGVCVISYISIGITRLIRLVVGFIVKRS